MFLKGGSPGIADGGDIDGIGIAGGALGIAEGMLDAVGMLVGKDGVGAFVAVPAIFS